MAKDSSESQACWSSVMGWACIANGTSSPRFIDGVTADNSSGMNSELFKAILSAHIQPNAPVKATLDCLKVVKSVA